MSAQQLDPKRKYTPKEYFDFLAKSEERYDYHDGEIRMMAGGTGSHNKVKGDTYAYLTFASREGACQPFDSDMAVALPRWRSYVFPDMSFVGGEEKYEDEGERRLSNPALLIEVISETSGDYDRGELTYPKD